MHFEQVLIDREQLCVFNLFDKSAEIFRVANLELLLRILVLFHVETVFDDLVSFDVLFVFWAPERVKLSNMLFQVKCQDEENHDGNRIW